MSYVVKVDDAACAAHGDCAVIAPAVFRIEEVAEVVGQADDAVLVEAAEGCPSAAIVLVDDDTGEQVYP